MPGPSVSVPVPDGEPAPSRPAWHGKASVWGAMFGVLVSAVVMGLPGLPGVSPYAVVWGAGVLLLLVRGRARQFGLGLVASGLVGPTLMALGQLQNVMWPHP